jgi:hypothetical protein
MKKIFQHRIAMTLLLAVVFVFCGNVPVFAAGNDVRLYVSPSSSSGAAGRNVAVQIRLSKDTNAKVDYAKADTRFSTAVLEVVSISRAGSYFTNNGGPTTSYNNSNGTLIVSGSGNTLPTTADALLVTVTFRVKTTGTGTITVTAASEAGDLLGGGNVKNVLTATSGSSITGESPPPAATPAKPATATPTPSPTSSPQPSATTAPETPTLTPPATNTEDVANDENTLQTTSLPEEGTTPSESPTFLSLLEPWQMIAGAVLGAGLVGGAAFITVARLRKHETMPLQVPQSAEEMEADTINQLPTEDSFFQPQSASVVSDEPQPPLAPMEMEAPVDPPQLTSPEVPEAPVVVAGVEIEPLDPAMPSPLTTVTQPEAVASAISDEPIAAPMEPQLQPMPRPESYAPVTTYEQPPVAVQQEPYPAPVVETPIAEEPITAGPEDEFPDMFEEGEARLRAEGLDAQLKAGKA